MYHIYNLLTSLEIVALLDTSISFEIVLKLFKALNENLYFY